MAYKGSVYAVRAGVTVYREPDGRMELHAALGTLPLSVTELAVLHDLGQDAIVGGDGCGQWHAWQAYWNGNAWCCPVCRHVLTFPF